MPILRSTSWYPYGAILHRRLQLDRAVLICFVIAALTALSASPAKSQGTSIVPDSSRTAADSAVVKPDTASARADAVRVPRADSISATPDTSIVVVAPVPVPTFRRSVFDSISHRSYLIRRTVSLDAFLELEPGFVVGRYGPIGKTALVSRYAFGRGRGTVYLNDTPVNDPQNDIAHLPHFPVSGLGVLLTNSAAGDLTPNAGGLEGRLRVVEAAPSPTEPVTFLGLSKSTQRNVRQRRVWFASMLGNIGLDFGYDEITNDGYSFDARQLYSDDFVWGDRYGEANSRYLTLNFRGLLPNGDKYTFSLRRFEGITRGDLESVSSEQGLGGHLASVSAAMGPVDIIVFSRSYDALSRPSPEADPDSQTVNLTTAAYADWTLLRSPDRSVEVGAGYETIGSLQTVGGEETKNRLQKATGRFAAIADVGADVDVRVELSGAMYRDLAGGWGGSVAAERDFGRHSFAAYLRRGYRLPNLGELFLPAHAGGTGSPVTITGNDDLNSEFGWELGGSYTTRIGPLVNEVKAFALRMDRPIAFAPTSIDGDAWLLAKNGDREVATVIANRLKVETKWRGFELQLAGSVDWTGGDRDVYFRTVPKWDAHASFRFGRSFFEATSALYFGLDYTHRDSRLTLSGGELPPYDLLNLKLDGRLLNADLYFMVVNVLDEKYETIEGYLMSPQTWFYGIAWQIFD